jgi:hypothetical protein
VRAGKERLVYESGRGRAAIRKNDAYGVYALQIRQACNNAGVSVIYIGYYLRYGRELWSLAVQRFHAGDTLAAEVALRVEKWKRLGLSEAVLHDIHSVVFNVPIPTP